MDMPVTDFASNHQYPSAPDHNSLPLYTEHPLLIFSNAGVGTPQIVVLVRKNADLKEKTENQYRQEIT